MVFAMTSTHPQPLRRGPHAPRIAMISIHGDPLMSIGAEEAGGQNVYVREVAQALAARGAAVDVFTRGRHCKTPEVIPMGGARVIRLPAGPTGFISRNELFPHLPDFLQAMRSFIGAQRLAYDVIHSNYWLSGWVGMTLSREWHRPHFHTHHSLGAVKYAATGAVPAAGPARLAVENMLIGQCATVVATSPEDVASMARHYPNTARTAIVPCGIDASIFRPQNKSSSRAALGLPDDRPILLYVGRFDPAKGIDTFVRAAAMVRAHHPVHLVFAGGYEPGCPDGDEFLRIQALVAELGLAESATFLGKVAHDQLPLVYSAGDICIVPSHYESFGMVAIEAMGCATPVVASDAGGLRYSVVHRETGLLATPRDPAAFASALKLMLDDPALRQRMGIEAHRLVHRMFTWDAVAASLEELYTSVIPVGRPEARRRA